MDTRLKLRRHYQVETDEELYDRLGIDNPIINVNRLMPEGWKPSQQYIEFCRATGYNLESEYANFEEWGICRRLGEKSGSMLQQYFFTRHPCDIFTKANQLKEVVMPSLDSSRFNEAASIVQKHKDIYLTIGALGHVLWTKGWELRGMLKFMRDIHTDPKMTEAILDKLLEYSSDLADGLLDTGCDGISISEDWGNNYSLFINPVLWRRYFKLRYQKLFQRVKRRGKFVFFHSDGNIKPILDDLVEIGIDSLNPVQPECMNQLEVKQKYGDKITIDTGISNQHILPFGTTNDVRREILHAFKHLAPGGGFVYGTSHYAMYDVPLDNIVALYEMCREYATYPIRVPE